MALRSVHPLDPDNGCLHQECAGSLLASQNICNLQTGVSRVNYKKLGETLISKVFNGLTTVVEPSEVEEFAKLSLALDLVADTDVVIYGGCMQGLDPRFSNVSQNVTYASTTSPKVFTDIVNSQAFDADPRMIIVVVLHTKKPTSPLDWSIGIIATAVYTRENREWSLYYVCPEHHCVFQFGTRHEDFVHFPYLLCMMTSACDLRLQRTGTRDMIEEFRQKAYENKWTVPVRGHVRAIFNEYFRRRSELYKMTNSEYERDMSVASVIGKPDTKSVNGRKIEILKVLAKEYPECVRLRPGILSIPIPMPALYMLEKGKDSHT